MSSTKICKTIHQWNKEPVTEMDMKRLLEIAADYCSVKNYVYQRYGGVKSLAKIYPGYTVQNEMTASGLREQLDMPAVYFYLAVFDALGDIKCQWTQVKEKVSKLVNCNENFTSEDKHYLRFLLKVSNAFEQTLNQKPIELNKDLQKQYEALSRKTDTGRLDRYLCRQVRKCHIRQHTIQAEGFALTERAYRYDDHGIYISTKEKRKRIFVPLTDNNRYNRQLYIKLYPHQSKIEIHVPIDVCIREHTDYDKQVGLAVGMYTMLTTDEGERYGTEFGKYQIAYADWIRSQKISYQRNRSNNPGREKYYAKKRRYEEQLHSYINHELNRFLQTEKPRTIFIPKLPKPQAGGVNRKINNSVSLWQRGYIRKRLEQKCRQESVKIVEVFGKDISNACSQCGSMGTKKEGFFSCPECGYFLEEKTNAAQNAKKRGQTRSE